jgi:SecD/SecF fusion protein
MDCYSMLDTLSSTLILVGQTVSKVGETKTEVLKAANPIWWDWTWNIAFILAVFVLPFLLSNLVSRALRMPALATRMSAMLFFIILSFMFAWNANFQMKLGPDMKGGTNLIYEIKAPADGSGKVNAGALATALSARLNPSGTNEMSIRPYGESQIEIIVPNVDEFELAEIKRKISKAGALLFRIVANTRDHGDIIELARQRAQSADRLVRTSMNVMNAEGKIVGKWYTVSREEKQKDGVFPLMTPVLGDIIRNSQNGQILSNPPVNPREDYALEKWMQRENIADVDVLMALEQGGSPYVEVSGDDLSVATVEMDSKTGQPAVGFKLTTEGSGKMLRMTVRNVPDGNFYRRMAIIMDDRVLSAPQLNSSITSSGQITGNFTIAEV